MERKKHNVEQNTPEWLAARLGKFTSSQMYRLFTDPRTKNSTKNYGLSNTAFAYCESKLAELFYQEDVATFGGNDATLYGHENEIQARLAFEQITGIETQDGNFWTYGDNGSSPDWLFKDSFCECKCFYSKVQYVRFVRTVNSADELKAFSKDYYYQTQHQLYTTGKDYCIMFGYDGRLLNKQDPKRNSKFYHAVTIHPNEEVFKQIEARVKVAADVVQDMLNELLK